MFKFLPKIFQADFKEVPSEDNSHIKYIITTLNGTFTYTNGTISTSETSLSSSSELEIYKFILNHNTTTVSLDIEEKTTLTEEQYHIWKNNRKKQKKEKNESGREYFLRKIKNNDTIIEE